MSLVGITIFIGLLLIMLPDFGEVSQERMTSASMTMCLRKVRAGIRSDLEKGNTVKTDYEIKCPKLISKLAVHSNGKIEVSNPTHGIQLSFEPVLKEGKVVWSCEGTPAEFVPTSCRQKTGQ